MHIIAARDNTFKLCAANGAAAGMLIYDDYLFLKGILQWHTKLHIENTATGVWKSFLKTAKGNKLVAELKVAAGSTIAVKFAGQKSKYRFKRTGGWKARFILLNKDGEEVMALLPQINWQKKTHDFTLQLNDEFEAECTPVLILHALHCACCSLNMLNGAMPALINV